MRIAIGYPLSYHQPMLKELYYYLTTPCPKPFRQLGYLSGLIAIQARYHRVGAAWQSHLQNSRQLILSSSALCPQHRKVVVLGSGLLLDVPLESLSQQFTQVVLLDIAHLSAVVKRANTLDNVTLLEHDITGLAQSLLEYRSGDPLPSPAASLPVIAQDADLVISSNLLSQLPITPSHYLQKQLSLEPQPLHNWQQAIITDHLQLLAAQNGVCCLICDTQHDYLGAQGELLERQSTLGEISLGNADQQWQWPIAPLGELDSTHQLVATVQGFNNWKPGAGNQRQDSQ